MTAQSPLAQPACCFRGCRACAVCQRDGVASGTQGASPEAPLHPTAGCADEKLRRAGRNRARKVRRAPERHPVLHVLRDRQAPGGGDPVRGRRRPDERHQRQVPLQAQPSIGALALCDTATRLSLSSAAMQPRQSQLVHHVFLPATGLAPCSPHAAHARLGFSSACRPGRRAAQPHRTRHVPSMHARSRHGRAAGAVKGASEGAARRPPPPPQHPLPSARLSPAGPAARAGRA